MIILSSKYLRMDDRTTACSTTLVTHTVRADFTRRHRWLSRRGHYEAGWSQLLARHFHTMPPAAPFPYHTETRSRFSHALPFFRNTVASSRSVTPPPIWVRYDAQKFSPPFVYSNLEMEMDEYSNRIFSIRISLLYGIHRDNKFATRFFGILFSKFNLKNRYRFR